MATLFRDLEGGYLVPYLNAKVNEQWQSSNTPNTNVQLSTTPVISGTNSILVSPGQVSVTNLITNGSFETNNTGWTAGVGTTANGGLSATNLGTRTTGQGYIGAFGQLVGANSATSFNGIGFSAGSQPPGTYTFQVAIKNGPGAPAIPTWQIVVGDIATPQSTILNVAVTGSYQVFTVSVTTTVTATLHGIIRYNGVVPASPTNVAYVDAALLYNNNYNQVISYIDTTASTYINTNAYSPVQYDLTNYDGVGMFMYCASFQYLDHVRVRFYTEDPTTLYPSYFETNLVPIGTAGAVGTQTLYGTGLYGSAVYSVVGVSVINWTEFIIPKPNFISVGTPSWGKITRTEITPIMLGGGLAPVYVDAISGWVHPLFEDNSANRIMNRLPNFYWDTDYYRQLCQQAGYEIDCLKATTRYGLDQRFVDFAEWGLRLWEKQYQLPIEPAGPMLKRRALVKTLFAQVGSKAEFISYLSGICDGGCQITELYSSYVVLVSAGVNTTSARNQLVLALARTIPAHLQVAVTYNAFVAGIGLAGAGLGPAYFKGTGETASFTDNAVKT